MHSTRAAQAEQPASVGGFIPCPFNLLAHHLPAAPLPKQTPAEPSHPSPHASHHSSTASLPLRAASRLAGAAGSDGGMEIDEAVRGCSDCRMRTKYGNAVYVVQRAFALYP